jgi:hypothetical protein
MSYNKLESITKIEKGGASNYALKEDAIVNQISQIRDTDPSGYLSNMRQMDKMGANNYAYPKLEFYGAEGAKMQSSTDNLGYAGAPNHALKNAINDGGLKNYSGLDNYKAGEIEHSKKQHSELPKMKQPVHEPTLWERIFG